MGWTILAYPIIYTTIMFFIIANQFQQRKIILTTKHFIFNQNVYAWTSIDQIFEIEIISKNQRHSNTAGLLLKIGKDKEIVVRLTDLNIDSNKLTRIIQQYWSNKSK